MPALQYLHAPQRRITPPPPRLDRLPATVRSALRLSGSIVSCGPGFRGLGWPETPLTRLAAIAEHLKNRRIASHLSAAWVWGALGSPPRLLHIAMPPGTRRPVAPPSGVRFYELRYEPDEITRMHEFGVTTPLRTISDLLFHRSEFGRSEHVSCRLLALRVPGGAHAVTQHISALRRPFSTLARSRADLIWGSI